MASFPVDDWQFWVTTAVFVGSLVLLVRPFLPRRANRKAAAPGCGGCSVATRSPTR